MDAASSSSPGARTTAATARCSALDLEADPELAKEPDISLAIAFAYWRERGINAAADADDVVRVTKLINGGRNGLAERTRLLAVAKTIWL